MRKLICLFILAGFPVAVFSQNDPYLQTSEPFPFNVVLLTPDSTVSSSEAVLGKKNNPTLLAFWLTTCMPCSFELDAYARHYADWQEQYGLQIVAVSVDFPERFRRIGERLKEKKYPFPVWWDQYRTFKLIMPGELNGLPQVFLFDKSGKMAWRHKGYSTESEQEMVAELEKMKKQ